jgi:hypothetical protein
VASFEEIEEQTSEELDITSPTFGFSTAADMRAAVRAELTRLAVDGDGLDGLAMDMVLGMLNVDGALYTDGECLDLAGIVIDAWRELDL